MIPSEEVVEAVARAMEPRVWQAFDGYMAFWANEVKDYTREQQRDAFIYGHRPVKGHDWGVKLQISLEHARAAIAAMLSIPQESDAEVTEEMVSAGAHIIAMTSYAIIQKARRTLAKQIYTAMTSARDRRG